MPRKETVHDGSQHHRGGCVAFLKQEKLPWDHTLHPSGKGRPFMVMQPPVPYNANNLIKLQNFKDKHLI